MINNILITGCAGLLGNHYVRYLLNKNYNIVGVDNLSGGYIDYLPTNNNFIFYEHDLIDSFFLKYLFDKYKFNTVFHFAAYAAEGLSPFIRNFNYTNNILCSINIINECIKHNSKLIFTSSMAVYGNQNTPFTEHMLPEPIDPYGIAKYAVEMDIKQANAQFNLQYNIIRPHNVIGIYQNIWDKYRNVIGIFIRRVINKEPILIYGDGEQTRAFSDIEFYMRPFHELINNHNGETFNIGADKYFSITSIVDIIRNIASKYGFEVIVEHKEPRHEVKHAYCDHSKAKKFLNFQDNTDIEKTITKMFEWAMTQPSKNIKTMPYEIEKNIYAYWK